MKVDILLVQEAEQLAGAYVHEVRSRIWKYWYACDHDEDADAARHDHWLRTFVVEMKTYGKLRGVLYPADRRRPDKKEILKRWEEVWRKYPKDWENRDKAAWEWEENNP